MTVPTDDDTVSSTTYWEEQRDSDEERNGSYSYTLNGTDRCAKLGVKLQYCMYQCTVHTLQYIHKFTCYIVTIIAVNGMTL